MKPMLKPSGNQRLKVKYDQLLSSFAFNFNLRLYTTDTSAAASASSEDHPKNAVIAAVTAAVTATAVTAASEEAALAIATESIELHMSMRDDDLSAANTASEVTDANHDDDSMSAPFVGAGLLASLIGGGVQVDGCKTRVDSAFGVCNQRLQLHYGETLSNFDFKFNLRRYTSESLARIRMQPQRAPRRCWCNCWSFTLQRRRRGRTQQRRRRRRPGLTRRQSLQRWYFARCSLSQRWWMSSWR
jgi:hypothetical protein